MRHHVRNHVPVSGVRGHVVIIAAAIAAAGAVFPSRVLAAKSILNGDTLEVTTPTPYATYGDITIEAGTLRLDNTSAATPTDLLSNQTALTFGNNQLFNSSIFVGGGSTLNVIGKPAGTPTSQTFAGTTFKPGASQIVIDPSGGGGTTVNLGAITRLAGSAVDLTTPAGAAVTTPTANAAIAGGSPTILGGYATVGGGQTWAVSAGDGTTPGAITGLSTFAFAPGGDVDLPTGTTAAPAATFNSARFNADGATVNLGGAVKIATGGVLVTPSVGAGGATIGGPGTLTSGNGGDLIVHQYSTNGRLTISAPIVDDGVTAIGVTKVGPGTLVLTGSNAYTGPTSIFGGVVEIPSITNVGSPGPLGAVNSTGAPSNIRLSGGTLRYTGASATTDRPIAVTGETPNNAIDVTNAATNLNVAGVVTFAGNLNAVHKAGPGTLTLSGTADNFDATFDVTQGTLVLAKTSTAFVHAVGSQNLVTVRSGATLRLGGTGGDQVSDGTGISVDAGGTFDLAGQSEGISRLRGGGTVTNSVGSTLSTLSIVDTLQTNPGVSGAFTGVIQDGPGGGQTAVLAGGILFSHGGIIGLAGPNTYTGPTTIRNGILQVYPGGRIGSPTSTADVVIDNGGSLGLLAAGISDLATLRITDASGSAEVNIAAGVSDTVGSLVLNNHIFGPGTYGSTASGAADNGLITAAGLNPNNYFSGPGVIVVAPEPAGLAAFAAFALTALTRRPRR